MGLRDLPALSWPPVVPRAGPAERVAPGSQAFSGGRASPTTDTSRWCGPRVTLTPCFWPTSTRPATKSERCIVLCWSPPTVFGLEP